MSRQTKSRRRRGKDTDGPKLPGPLSELTKHMSHISIRDMEALVNRPLETRRQEAVRKGKVVRPMNSFMLYRSAYTERAKEWCAQNNHQVVSKVCGMSWPLEEPAIREKYEFLALKERDSHREAHPDYKFAPAKTSGSTKRNQVPPRVERESPDIDDYASASSYMDSGRIAEVDSSFGSRGSTPLDTPSSSFDSSSWLPLSGGMMTPPEPPQHYLQTSVQTNAMGAHVEDVRFRRIERPESQIEAQLLSSSALAGLPGSAHHDLLQPPTSAPAPGQSSEGQLDSQALNFQNRAPSTGVDSQDYNSFQYYWQEDPTTNCYLPVAPSLTPTSMPYQTLEPSYSSDFHSGPDGHDSWGLTHDPTFDDSKDFDHWLDPQLGF